MGTDRRHVLQTFNEMSREITYTGPLISFKMQVYPDFNNFAIIRGKILRQMRLFLGPKTTSLFWDTWFPYLYRYQLLVCNCLKIKSSSRACSTNTSKSNMYSNAIPISLLLGFLSLEKVLNNIICTGFDYKGLLGLKFSREGGGGAIITNSFYFLI